MPKNCDDMEDIVRLLVSMLDDKRVEYENVKLKLREYHYCIDCCQHYKRCVCDMNDTSESGSSTSSITEDYESSEISDDPDD